MAWGCCIGECTFKANTEFFQTKSTSALIENVNMHTYRSNHPNLKPVVSKIGNLLKADMTAQMENPTCDFV